MELGGGRYVLHEALGSGGAATVYRAWDTALQVPRAVKILHEVATDAALGDRRRILAEARVMARLDVGAVNALSNGSAAMASRASTMP